MTRYFLRVFLCYLTINVNLVASESYVEKKEPNSIHSQRLWHFVLRSVDLKNAFWLVDVAKKNNFNAVVIQIADGVVLNKSPWTPQEDAWSKKEFIQWVNYAKLNGMDVIPEIKLLSHQEKFLQNNYPGLMYNSNTYDPSNSKVYNIVFPLLDEIIEIINPSIIHIGHDELKPEKNNLFDFFRDKKILPANLFLKDIIIINNFLNNKKISTAMWGDMLLSPTEFPLMSKHYLNGGSSGYGKSLRKQLPKSIIIFDWHYIDEDSFKSMEVLREEGFTVIPTTWRKEVTIEKFSRASKREGSSAIMASLWFYVQRGEWDIVESILSFSGREFPVTTHAQ